MNCLSKSINRLIISLLLIVSFVAIFPQPAHAQPTTRVPGFMSQSEFVDALTGPTNLTSWSVENMGNILWGMTAFLGGVRLPNGTVQPGASQQLMLLHGYFYNNTPVSTQEYIADVGSRLNLIEPALAEYESGTVALAPTLGLWKLFRNICYVFFIVIFVVFGFMIMFRSKLNPQTVVNLQHALPKIIIGLILVTFSYAISGLIVDISEITLRVVASTFKTQYAPELGIPGGLIDKLTNPEHCGTSCDPKTDYENIFSIMLPLYTVGEVANAIQDTLNSLAATLESQLGALGTIAGAIVGLIFSLSIIQAIFKSFFMLLSSYVNIILATILSPFVFLGSSIMGNQAISSWAKSFLANVLVFPLSFSLLLLAAIFAHNPATGSVTKWNTIKGVDKFSWFPAPLGLYWSADSSGAAKTFDIGLINQLIAFGIIISVPKTLEIIKGALEGKGAPGVGAEIGQTVMRGASKIPILGSVLN